MSHLQSKGDRSEAQLKKAGRSSGPGHQRSGAPSTAVKGGGAGGPGPSGSAPPSSSVSLSASQSFPAAGTSGRPTTPGSSSNRGGKRVNGPPGLGRNAQIGGSTDHGGNYRNAQYSAAQYQSQHPQQQQPVPIVRQGSGPTEANQHPPTSSGQQLELKPSSPPRSQPFNSVGGSRLTNTGGAQVPVPKQSSNALVPGVASKPPPPVVPSSDASVPEPASPVATGSPIDTPRSSVQPSFAFQFGSISPGFMNGVPGMQIPARTSSAPPNLDEQKREQARFEASRAVVSKKVPTVPSGQGQVTRVAGNASERPQPVLQPNQIPGSQGLLSGAGSLAVPPQQQPGNQAHGLSQPSVQYSQGQGQPVPVQGQAPQHSQAPIHMPAQVQVTSQHLAVSPQQQSGNQAHGLSQPSVQYSQGQGQAVPVQGHGPQHSQAPPIHMPAQVQVTSQHLPQIQLAPVQAHAQQQQPQQQALPQQPLPQQGLVPQSLSQGMKYSQPLMAPHGAQMISQHMGNPLGGQLSAQQVPPHMAHLGPQMGGSMGGQLPPGISGSQYGPPAPNRSRAVKIVDPVTREELRFEAKAKKGDPFMDVGPTTSVAASPGLSGRGSGNGTPSRPVNYGFYQSSPYTHSSPSFYQQVPAKNVSTPGGPPGNTPSARYYGPQSASQGLPFMNHPGTVSNSPASKVGQAGGIGGGLTVTETGVAPSAPLVAAPLGGSPHPIVQTVPSVASGRQAATSQSLQSGGSSSPALNGRASGLVPPAAAIEPPPGPPTSPAKSAVDFKFGDVEASGSAGPVSSGESPTDNLPAAQTQLSGTNGTSINADPGLLNQIVPIAASEGLSSKTDQVSKANTSPAVTTPRPSLSIPPVKPVPSGPTVGSPQLSAVSSSVPLVTGDKPKTESLKPAAISRENSRKLKKEQKQHKQQHHQPLLTVAIPVEGEGEKKVEAITNSPTSGVGDLQTSTAIAVSTGAAMPSTVLKPSLQRSNSGVQSQIPIPSGPMKLANPSGRLEENKVIPKVAIEAEKRHVGKPAGLSPQSSEVVIISTSLAAEVEEGAHKPFSKQGSGKVLSSVKSLEGKDDLNTDSSASSKVGTYPKLNSSSSSKALLSGPPVKELSTGKVSGSLPKKNLEAQVPQIPQVAEGTGSTVDITQKGVIGEDSTAEDQSPVEQLSDAHDLVRHTGLIQESSTASEGLVVQEEGLIVDTDASPVIVEDGRSDVSEQDSLVLKTANGALDSLADGGRTVEEELTAVSMDVLLDPEQSIPNVMTASTGVSTSSALHIDVVPPVTEKEIEQKVLIAEEAGTTDQAGEESTAALIEPLKPSTSGIEKEVGTEDMLSNTEEIEECVVDTSVSSLAPSVAEVENGLSRVAINDHEELSEVHSGQLENMVRDQESPGDTGNLPSPPHIVVSEEGVTDSAHEDFNVQPGDDGVPGSPVSKNASESQHENTGSTDEDNPREVESNAFATSSTELENLSISVPEVKQARSNKKKKREIYAKADAQGPTADLFTAYKAPEEKKLDEVKRAEAPGSSNPGMDTKKDSIFSQEKPVFKELDDWEDAAELPTPQSAPTPSSASPDTNLVPGGVPNHSDFAVKKYTKDYLMSQRELHKDLPPQFEIRADIAEQILQNQTGTPGFTDALPSPGRGLDRQSSGGPRLDRRNSNVGAEEDRWTRQGVPVASPGRGPGDARMESMTGPPGGFRPGQGANPGLMRMPPGMRPGVGPPGIMPIGGLLPGGPLLPQHMMMPVGPGRNIAGVDADRWQRAPAGQKGLIPSPRTPLPAIHKTENRYQVGKVSDEEQLKQRLIKGILNKLTPQNFEKLFAQVKEVNIDSATTLTGVISQIFDKALTEPTFCEMYAKFCVQLAVELPEFVEGEEKITFKRVLLNKCQEEFERGEREQEEAEKVEEDGEVKLTAEEREEKRTSARRRMLGNIRFIGELYKKNMLTERIMHECIKKLLGEYQNPDEEDVEALCKLMSTIGRIIDHPKAKEHIDAYFKRMEMLSENLKLSSRLRFMLKDVIDLRRNGWQERRKVEGPKKIDEVHRDAVQERQQAAASSRDRPQQRGGMVPGGGRRPGSDFAMRGPQSPMFSPGPPMGGIRGAQPPPGPVRSGFGQGQDVRMEGLLMDSRPMPMPLSQRPSDEGPLTLGPQGGLGRAMAMRQPMVPGRSALAEVPPMMLSDARRPGMGPMPGFGGLISDRGPYGGREEMRGPGPERPIGAVDRPLLERPLAPERLGPPLSGRDLRGPDRPPAERPSLSVTPSVSLRPRTPPAQVVVRSTPTIPLPLTEDELKKKSKSTIVEYFSLHDTKEAAQCVDDLKNPKFHPMMLSVWVSEALDKKDLEREHLVKLLIHLCKETEPSLLTPEHTSKGFDLVLSALVDTTMDVPRAPEYVARMLAMLIIAGVFTLAHVGKLVKEGGTDPGVLLEIGDALLMIGVILDTIKREKGEVALVEMYRVSKLNVEDFLSPEDKRKGGKFEIFLEKKSLQCLYPMIPLEKYFREAFDRDDPVTEIIKWVQKNVPESTSAEPAFLRMIMTQVLRHSVPLDASGEVVVPPTEKVLEVVKKYATLLKNWLPKSQRLAETSQRQYIMAVQLFANDLGYPPGLITALFQKLYAEDVIFEWAFQNWKDDVKDSTPGRDKAIKETYNWFWHLETAREESGEDDE